VEEGHIVLMVLDIQGAKQVQKSDIPSRLIFINPPSLDVLDERLRSRGNTDEHEMARRLAMASAEMAEASWFDWTVINNDVETAARMILQILRVPPRTMDFRGPQVFSMGARVDHPTCSVPGCTPALHPEHSGYNDSIVAYDDLESPKFFITSLVSAPLCDSCKSPMDYLDRGTEWMCRSMGCSLEGQGVHTGIGGIIAG
jgi:hypothetical protein